jgi:seryl-tRNA synthetase
MSQDTIEKDETAESVESEETVTESETGDVTDFEEYPQDHPLVKTLAKQRAELKELKREHTKASKELDTVRKSQLSDQERLLEEVKDETRRAVRLEFAEKLVEAEVKSALKGRSLVGDAVLEFSKQSFVDESGDIDSDAITTWVEAHSIQTDSPKPDLGQGARGNKSSLAQIRTRDELATMTPDEVLSARKDGRLDSLMGKL